MTARRFGHRSLAPRVMALIAYRESVERVAVAFSKQPVQLEGFTDPAEALDAMGDSPFDAAIVNAPWGDEFDRSLLETLGDLDPALSIIALTQSPQAAAKLEADPALRLTSVLVEPWSPAQLCRAVRANVFDGQTSTTRAAQGALGTEESTGRTSLLPQFTLPALLRLAGQLLFPKTPDSRQGALGRTDDDAENNSRWMAKTLVRVAGQGPARAPAGGYVSA